MGARRAVHIRFSTVCYQPEKSGKFKIVREKGIIKENRRYLAEEKWITSAELLVLKEKIEKYGGTL